MSGRDATKCRRAPRTRITLPSRLASSPRHMRRQISTLSRTASTGCGRDSPQKAGCSMPPPMPMMARPFDNSSIVARACAVRLG